MSFRIDPIDKNDFYIGFKIFSITINILYILYYKMIAYVIAFLAALTIILFFVSAFTKNTQVVYATVISMALTIIVAVIFIPVDD